MRFLPIVLILAAFVFACSKSPEAVPAKPAIPEAQKEDQYKKELEEVRKTLKGDIKIKLKKDGKGDFYSWEIDGKDVAEVLKVNEALTRKLEPPPQPSAPR